VLGRILSLLLGHRDDDAWVGVDEWSADHDVETDPELRDQSTRFSLFDYGYDG